MTSDHVLPHATLTLELAPSLAPLLDPNLLQDNLKRSLTETLHVLGIPGEPVVRVTAAENAVVATHRPLAVAINGEFCPYPDSILRRAYHYVVKQPLNDALTLAQIGEGLQQLSSEQVGLFAQLSCDEIVRSDPAALLTEASTLAYRNGLDDKDDAIPEARELQGLLAAVLSLRVSIADQVMAARVLREGRGKPHAALAEDLLAALRPKRIELQLPSAYLKDVTLNASESDLGSFALLRDGLFYELGLRFPALQFAANDALEPDSFAFRLNHLTTLPWRGLTRDECLVNETPEHLRLFGVEGKSASNPANWNAAGIIATRDKSMAEGAGLTAWSQIGYLVLALSSELRSYAACFLDSEAVNAYLDDLGAAFPQLVQAARKRIPLELVTQTLRLLLAEEISIRNLRYILQALIDHDFIVADAARYIIFDSRVAVYRHPGEDWLNDPVNLASGVRETMKRFIGHKYTQGQSTLIVYLLDPKIEELLANREALALEAHRARIGLPDRERILAAVRAEVSSLSLSATMPAILTTTDVRTVVRALIAPEFPNLPVLSYQELPPDLNIQPIARISWD